MKAAFRFLALLLVLPCLFSAGLLSISADSVDSPPATDSAAAVYLYHTQSQTVILEKNSETRLSAGSTVKILSGLLFCEALAQRQTETVYLTQGMLAESAGYRLYLKAGDTLTVEQLLYAALCSGFNDAYDALASYVAGNRSAFVEQMNRRATELGCQSSYFSDPSGVDDASYTSAADLFLIASAAMQNSLYMDLTSTPRYAFSGSQKLESRDFFNRNELIYPKKSSINPYYNADCRGMNAGSTARGGNCVVTAATRDKDTYLAIVLGASEDENGVNFGYQTVNRLLDWAFSNYGYLEIFTSGDQVCTIPVTLTDKETHLSIITKSGFSCFLPKNTRIGEEITFSIRLNSTELEAPVSADTQVGYVAILYQGKTLHTLPIYTAESVERNSFMGGMQAFQALIKNRAFLAGFLFFAVALSAWLIIEAILQKQRHTKWDKYFSMKMDPAPYSLDPKDRTKKH